MKGKYKISHIVDGTTGEIIPVDNIEGKRVILVEEGGYYRSPKQVEYMAKKEARYNDNTPYIWANFNYGRPYFPEIDDSNITRLIFFATFCNNLDFVMYKQDIKEMLKLNYNQVKNFKDTLTKHNIISIDCDKVFLSKSAFYRGPLQEISKDFIRIFLETNQKLYASCTTTQHKKLSYIYRMIPYVNRQTNILSYNQQEQDTQYIVYRTIKDFCRIIGYDPSHSSRLKTELLNFRINGELAVGFFDEITELNPNGKYVVVNPKLFYGGEREKKAYKDICKLFKKEKEAN